MEYRRIIKDISEKKYKPVYILQGEEVYFIDIISDYIEKVVLDESEKDFNLSVVYGSDTDGDSLLAIAKSYPMLAERRVVILKEAQNFKDWDKLESYMQNPVPSTIFVVCHKYGVIDKRRRINKILTGNKHIEFFTAEPLGEVEIIQWIQMQFKVRKIQIDEAACFALKELIGDDLSAIFNQIEKLAISLPEGSVVRLEEVAQNVSGSREYNAFELQSALAHKNTARVYKILNVFTTNTNRYPIQPIIGALYSFFVKVLIASGMRISSDGDLAKNRLFPTKDIKAALTHYKTPKLEEIVHILYDYDLRSKGVNNQSNTTADLMKEMVFKILH